MSIIEKKAAGPSQGYLSKGIPIYGFFLSCILLQRLSLMYACVDRVFTGSIHSSWRSFLGSQLAGAIVMARPDLDFALEFWCCCMTWYLNLLCLSPGFFVTCSQHYVA